MKKTKQIYRGSFIILLCLGLFTLSGCEKENSIDAGLRIEEEMLARKANPAPTPSIPESNEAETIDLEELSLTTDPEPKADDSALAEEDDIEAEISTDDTYNIAEELNNIWGPAEHDEQADVEDYTLDDLMGATNSGSTSIDEFNSIIEEEDDLEWKTIYNSDEPESPTEQIRQPDTEKTKTEQAEVTTPQQETAKPKTTPVQEVISGNKTNSAKQIYQIVNRVKEESSEAEQSELLRLELQRIPSDMESVSFLMDLKPFLPTSLHDPINGKIAEILELQRGSQPEIF